jgi:signal transduction histidine kinase
LIKYSGVKHDWGILLSYELTIEDVEKKYDESALFGIQRLKSRLVTQISHEFRTPLTSIIGFAEMLEESLKIDDNRRVEYARHIRNEGLRLSKLIDDYLELESLELGIGDLKLELSEINVAVYQAVSLLEKTFRSKSVNISIVLPQEPIIAEYDIDKITEALFQLLHNAIHFTKPGGSIVLEARATDMHVALIVQDNGPGISAKEIPSLFKKFGKLYYPGEDTHSTGVGLAIVKYIVDQHRGEIDVESQIGEGSTFTIRIPLQHSISS